ncbi:MAG: TolC family protein [Gemmatimonadota bacterium]
MSASRVQCAIASVLLAAALSAPASVAAQQPITLAEAVRMARQQGLEARAARASLEATRHRDVAFDARHLPQLSLSGTVPSYNRSIIPVLQPDGSTIFRAQQQTSADLTMTMSQQLPVTGGSFFVSSSLSRLTVSGQQQIKSWTSTPVQVGLRQDIFRPNTARWDQRQQDATTELSERLYLEAMEEIAIQTTQAFFDVYSARATLANSITNAATNDTLYTLNKGRFEVGKIGENDLLQSELALLRSRAAVQTAQLGFDRAVALLRLNLNLPPGTAIEVSVTNDLPQLVLDTTRAVAEALRNRSSVSDAALQDVLARRRIAEARLARGVGATVQASFGLNATAPEASLAYQDLVDARQFSLSVELPLWQWGARSQEVDAARSDQERTASLSEASIDRTALDAHFAVLELNQAQVNVGLAAKADTVAGQRFEVAYNRYVIGRIAIDNLYIAQSEKDQALNEFVQALEGYWLAYYRLRRATLFDFATGQAIRARN